MGVTDATVTLGPFKVSSSFYVVRGLKYGILGTEVMASLEIQIDVARISMGKRSLSLIEWSMPLSLQSVLY